MEPLLQPGDLLLGGKAVVESVGRPHEDKALHVYTIAFLDLPPVATNVRRQASFTVGYSRSPEGRLQELEREAQRAYRRASRDVQHEG